MTDPSNASEDDKEMNKEKAPITTAEAEETKKSDEGTKPSDATKESADEVKDDSDKPSEAKATDTTGKHRASVCVCVATARVFAYMFCLSTKAGNKRKEGADASSESNKKTRHGSPSKSGPKYREANSSEDDSDDYVEFLKTTEPPYDPYPKYKELKENEYECIESESVEMFGERDKAREYLKKLTMPEETGHLLKTYGDTWNQPYANAARSKLLLCVVTMLCCVMKPYINACL